MMKAIVLNEEGNDISGALERLRATIRNGMFQAAAFMFAPRAQTLDGIAEQPTVIAAANFGPHIEQWTAYFTRGKEVRRSAIYETTTGSILPVWWSLDLAPYFILDSREEIEGTRLELFKKAESFLQIRSGVSVPMHFSGGGFGYISLATNAGLDELPYDDPSLEMELLGISYQFFHSYLQLTDYLDITDARLSKRELACLQSAALGETLEQAGTSIGISANTVRFHLKNACTKLKARNRTHAVAKAAYQGLVRL